MTKSPFLVVTVLTASAIFDLSYGSIVFKISTLDKKSSYYYLFLEAASLTILLNVGLSNSHKTELVLALIDAALGALYNKASSPKDSPG